ncbi:MAG: hypothetical protein MAG451_00929 [Anaerolineales bacterium]|nr:hypothetical protein [Anaerolineales bacterium]
MLIVLCAFLLLILPGYLALLLVLPAGAWPLPVPSSSSHARRGLDPMLQVALSVGASLAILPLGFLYTTLLGVTLTPVRLSAVLAVMAILALWRLWGLRWRPLAPWRDRSIWPALAMFGGLLALTLVLRMWQARGLAVSAWVDGVHHTLIARLIAEEGRVPSDYGPYLDGGPFIYHFGFHALAAALAWLTGLPVHRAVLVMGQVLNALLGVGLYGLTVTLMRGRAEECRNGEGKERENRADAKASFFSLAPSLPCSLTQTAGLLAMGVVGTISLMPAYYVTWGRYTQLAGLALLPTAFIFSLWWIEDGKRWALVLASMSVAGLGVVHYRVLVFYGAFVVVYLGYRITEGAVVGFVRAAVLAGASLLLLAPWIARMAVVLTTRGAWPGLQVDAQYTTLPYDLLLMRRNLLLVIVASWGLTLGMWRRHRGVIAVGLWVLLLAAIAAAGFVAVPASVVVISLFLPVAVLVGYFVAEGVLAPLPHRGRTVAGVGLLFVALGGAAGMRSVINPATILFTQDDMDAVAWVCDNTPLEARFLINNRLWQGNVRVGTDAGYWLSVLADRETVPPPALYVLGTPGQVDFTNQVSGPASHGHLDPTQLRNAGITHVFLGSRGGAIDAAALLSDPDFDLLYADGGAWVFGLGAPTDARTAAAESVP